MQLLISDANILIDMEEGRLIEAMFQLPWKFSVPDILFYEELEQQHSHLVPLGLSIEELSVESLTYVAELTRKVVGPSRNDCFALALAKQEKCPLLTGDKALRETANAEKVAVYGTIWLVEQLITYEIINPSQAKEAFVNMRANARRLPWDLANKMLARCSSNKQDN